MKRRKIAKLMAVVALVGAVGVGGSLALLTAETGAVTNTFTVGNGLKDTDLELDETDYTNPSGDRVKANTYNNLTPTMTLTKDPQVRVSGEETVADCYVFIKVEGYDKFLSDVNTGYTDSDGNGLDDTTQKVLSTINGWSNKWRPFPEERTEKDGLYVYNADGIGNEGTVVDSGLSENVFNSITLSKDATLYDEDGNKKDISTITVDALAVQATAAASSWDDAKEVAENFNWE